MALDTGCGLLCCPDIRYYDITSPSALLRCGQAAITKKAHTPRPLRICLNSLLGPRWRHYFPESPVASQTLPALGALSPRRRASRSAAKARLCSRMACELSSAQCHFRSDRDPVGLLESFSAPLSSPRGVTLRCLMVCQQTAACPLSCPGPDRSRIAPHVGCHDGLRLVGSSLSPLPPFPRVQSLLTAAALGRPAGGSGSQCFCLQLSAPSLLMPRPPPPLSSKRLGPCHCTWCSYIRLGAFSSGNHVSTLFRCSVSFLL